MALSRLQNFINNPTGVVLFVDPNNFDATDGIENRGTSPGRPFFSIARACIEASRFSFVPGRNNDRNDRTTILVSPGTHYIDNRPGFSIQDVNGTAVYRKRTGKDTWTNAILEPLSENSNFDVFDPNNDLYKYNSVNGGIILPRGTSIVGQDLRKTKIRPLYVPDPLDPNVERSSIFNVTGSCYFREFTFFDADTTKFSYKNYTDSRHVPKYSHHKITTFVYADGVNPVRLGLEQTNLTDLDMYYYKITRAYDVLSGRGLEEYPLNLDLETNINEFRIVGALQENPLGITSIRAGNGDGTGDNNVITITTADLQTKIEKPHNFAVDTPIIIKGVTESPTAYNGSFTVREVVGINTFTFVTPVVPSEVLPNPATFDIATVSVESDTVSSSSPYVFSCSLRSVYGMCGMWADGSKANGFKSMVVAQFTGVSLQKDDDAYIIYDDGIYYDNLTLPDGSPLRPLHQNSRAIFKPEFENFHIRASNDSFIQVVSVFAIGYAKHFVTESGADMSITNSNSNFGANSLNSVGFKKNSFDRDDTGYITHIIPPRELTTREDDVSWVSLDIQKIQASADPRRLFLYSYDKKDIAPPSKANDFRIGAKEDDKLFLTLTGGGETQTTFSTPIFMTTPGGTEGLVSKKEYQVARVGTTNNIVSNTITLTEPHRLFNGEKVRIFSDNAQAPIGLEVDKIYYTITNETDNSLGNNQIKLAFTLNDAISGNPISGLGNNGGFITVLSTVTDKVPGEFGHPVQWDETYSNWYLNASQFSNLNDIYTILSTINTATFGIETPSSFIRRVQETRPIDERLYRVRYVIPKEYISAKAPQIGYIIQESKNVAISTVTVDEGRALLNSTELRNEKIITNATAGPVSNNTQLITVTTERPHNFIPDDTVIITSILSTNNPSGVGIVSTYNGEYKVRSVPTSRTFTYRLEGVKVNPGTFINNINQRTTRQQRDLLPLVSRQAYKNNFYIYKVNTIRNHVPGSDGQDGIYHLTVLSSSIGIRGNVGYGLSEKYFNQDIRNLYPQVDRDNVSSDPDPSISFADLEVVGRVITDDKKKSITLETVNEFVKNTRVGFGVTNVVISGVGNTTLTLFTDVEHKLNSIKSVNFITQGAGYPINSTFFSRNLIDLLFNEEDATCKYSTTNTGVVNPNTFRLVDVGAAHTVGERLGIQGGSITNAIVEVAEIVDNTGDTLQLSGFNSTELNGIYEIVGVPNKKTVSIYVPEGLEEYTANTTGSLPVGYIASKGVGIDSIILSDLSVGIATVTTTYPHGLAIGNKFKFTDVDEIFYDNKNFVVSGIVGISTFTFNVGIASTTDTPTVGKVLKYGISSNALNLGRGEENLTSRACNIYSGLTVRLTSTLNISSNTINVDNANGIFRGDYIVINSEILRVSSFPAGNTFNVLRNQLGTLRTTAIPGAVVKRIKVVPTEIRRPSFMRASGHTFEYLGFGPGNYSTALPQRQDRILSEVEVLTSQAKKEQGGSIVYTGMNDLGEFYTGSTKVSATTGEQTTIDAPILTFTGDDVDSESQSRQTGIFSDLLVRDRITVEGGENNTETSQFYGPVIFTKRVTNLSNEGVLLRNLYLRGTSPREKLLTVGISTPTSSSIPNPSLGDISFISNPENNYIGHVYKTGELGGEWRQWGLISNTKDILDFTVDRLGIGDDADDVFNLNVVGTSQLENLSVRGSFIVFGNTNLKDVTFEDVTILGTALYLGINPATGIAKTYTQIHERGISKFNDVETVGLSTFYNDVIIKRAVIGGAPYVPTLFVPKIDLDNIRVGVANSNTIDTKFGDLRLTADSGFTNINSNLLVQDGDVWVQNVRSTGVTTAYIEDSSVIKLGVGNRNQISYIEFNNDTRSSYDFGLRLVRNSGAGDRSSSLIHRGIEPLTINAFDNADVRILTNNTERLRVGSSGTVTVYQNNSGRNLQGGHLRLTQNGTGDVALSWDITRNNANVRWYAGIDVADSNSWKLSNPLVTTAYGNENFTADYKLKVDTSGTLSVANNINLDGNTISCNTPNTNPFTLLNTNILTLNAFQSATAINLASNSNTSSVLIRGVTESTSATTGALRVSGGVGIAKSVYIGGSLLVDENITLKGSNTASTNFFKVQNNSGSDRFVVDSANGNTSISGTLDVFGNALFEESLTIKGSNTASTNFFRVQNNNGVNRFIVDSTTGNTVISGITTISGSIVVSGNSSVGGNSTVSGSLDVFGNALFEESLTIKGSNTANVNFFRVQNNSGTNRFVVDSTTGNTVISGITTVSGSLDVFGNALFEESLTIKGSNTASTNFFRVQNNSGTNRFVVDSTTGNTVISGITTISGSIVVSGNSSVGGNSTISGTLDVTNDGVFNESLTVRGSNTADTNFFRVQNNNGANRFTVDSANGNTSISGSLDVFGNALFEESLTIKGSNTADTNFFRVQNNNGANRFTVDSANGNTSISGTLNVTNDGVFNESLVVQGSNTASTNFFRVQNNSGSDRFVVDSANGNTSISGTLSVSGSTTFNGNEVSDLKLKKYGETYVDLGTVSGNISINLNNGSIFRANISANSTFSFTNPITNSANSFTLILRNGAANLSVTWPSNVRFPNGTTPTRTLTSGRTDIWIFISPDGGTTWYGNLALYNFA